MGPAAGSGPRPSQIYSPLTPLTLGRGPISRASGIILILWVLSLLPSSSHSLAFIIFSFCCLSLSLSHSLSLARSLFLSHSLSHSLSLSHTHSPARSLNLPPFRLRHAGQLFTQTRRLQLSSQNTGESGEPRREARLRRRGSARRGSLR